MTLAGKNPLELPKRPSVILPSPGNEERFAFEALKQKAEKLIAHVEKKLDPYKSKKNEKRFDSAFSDLETAKEELAKAEEKIKEPVLPFFYGTLKIRNAIFSAIAALTHLKTATGGQIYRPTPESVKEHGGILFSPFEKTIKSWEEHPRYETTPKGIIDYLKTINLPAGTNFKSVNARIANEKLLIDAVVGTRAGDAKFTAILENEPNGGLKVLSHKIDLPLLARGFRGQIEGYITNLNSAITGQINKTIDPNWEFRNISIGDDKLIFDFNKKAGAKPTPPTPDSTTTPSTVAGLSEEEEFTRRREKASPMIDRLTDEIFNKHQQRVPREKIRIVLESANSSWGYLLDEDSLRKVASTLETLADREGMDFSEMVNQFLEKMKKGEVKTPEATATPPPTEEQPPTAVGPSDEDEKTVFKELKEKAEVLIKRAEGNLEKECGKLGKKPYEFKEGEPFYYAFVFLNNAKEEFKNAKDVWGVQKSIAWAVDALSSLNESIGRKRDPWASVGAFRKTPFWTKTGRDLFYKAKELYSQGTAESRNEADRILRTIGVNLEDDRTGYFKKWDSERMKRELKIGAEREFLQNISNRQLEEFRKADILEKRRREMMRRAATTAREIKRTQELQKGAYEILSRLDNEDNRKILAQALREIGFPEVIESDFNGAILAKITNIEQWEKAYGIRFLPLTILVPVENWFDAYGTSTEVPDKTFISVTEDQIGNIVRIFYKAENRDVNVSVFKGRGINKKLRLPIGSQGLNITISSKNDKTKVLDGVSLRLSPLISSIVHEELHTVFKVYGREKEKRELGDFIEWLILGELNSYRHNVKSGEYSWDDVAIKLIDVYIPDYIRQIEEQIKPALLDPVKIGWIKEKERQLIPQACKAMKWFQENYSEDIITRVILNCRNLQDLIDWQGRKAELDALKEKLLGRQQLEQKRKLESEKGIEGKPPEKESLPIPDEIKNEIIQHAISSAEEGIHSDEYAEILKGKLKKLREKGFSENELTDLAGFSFRTFIKNKDLIKELSKAGQYQEELLKTTRDIHRLANEGKNFQKELQRAIELHGTVDSFVKGIKINVSS